jgi:hypothetical protein
MRGGGPKTRLHDYITLRVPFVTNRKGAEAIDLRESMHARVTDGVGDAFSFAVAELVEYGDKRATLEKNLTNLPEALNWSRLVDRMNQCYYDWMWSNV